MSKKLLSLLLCAAMLLSLSATALAAGGAELSVSLDKTTVLTSAQTQTVILSIAPSAPVSICDYGFKVVVPQGWSIGAVTNDDANAVLTVGDYNLQSGTVGWTSADMSNVTVSKFAAVSITVPANTAAGSYDLQVVNVAADADYAATPVMTSARNKTVTLTVTDSSAYENYTVTADADKTVTAGEDVTVNFTVGHKSETKYNAFQLIVTYDTDLLTYKSCSPECSVDANKGTLTIAGHGADKGFDTGLAITFTTGTVGSCNVTLTSARIDKADNANLSDAPAADIIDGTTKVTAANYTVELPVDFTGASTVAKGADYTFEAANKNYEYTLTATMGGESAALTDNQDGTWTIANVTGSIVVTETARTGKSHSVTVNGAGAEDVTGAATAAYGTAYSFTVNEKTGYSYGISITVGGLTYSGYTKSGSAYTIPGKDIIGDMVITVAKTSTTQGDEHNVSVIGSGAADVTYASKAQEGVNYSFSITKAAGYTYTVAITIGTANYTGFTETGGVYTIPGADITGDMTISVTKTVDVTVNVYEYVKLDGKSMFLVTAACTALPQGETLGYDGSAMYTSSKYQGAYVWVMISDLPLADVKAEAESKITQITASSSAVSYNGDVNGTQVVDVNDAQLVYNIYNGMYEDFTAITVQKLLKSDMNGDKSITVLDAAAIVNIVLG